MPGRPKELRLGLVCYGGSSLAIYMHGVTKELNRLVKASVLRGAGREQTTPSEHAYGRLLDRLVEESDLPELNVVVDVIAGTSAGGINGIYLAKALAGNRSQDGLRKLWFENGDMNQLLVYPRRIVGIPWSWKLKLPFLIPRALRRSVLRGNEMVRWLYGALDDMDKADPVPPDVASLLPRGHPLDLFVTVTDFYGYERMIALDWPRFVAEGRHRHALSFHYDDGGDDDLRDNGGLTFAARATSSFPVAFPPVSLADVSAVTGADLAALRDRCFRIYQLSGSSPDSTFFVDGGVLDNKPFGWAIDTIFRKRPAESEVDRRLLYIEPDPGVAATREGGESPDTFHSALGALTTIPRSEPILDDLLLVDERNELVQRVREAIESNFERVAAIVGPIVPPEALTASPPEQWPWQTWNRAVHDAAIANAGLTYATYVRAKIGGVVDGIAASINAICNYPRESNHAQLVRAAVHAWAEERGLFSDRVGASPAGEPCAAENQPRSSEPEPYQPTDDQVAFLRAFDLGFVRRRTRFVIAAFNWWYRCVGVTSFPDRADLDQGKAILYDTIADLDALARLRLRPDAPAADREQADALTVHAREVFDQADIASFLTQHGLDGHGFASSRQQALADLFTELQSLLGRQLPPVAPRLLARVHALTAQWDPRRRRDLVVRYLGFPIWDVLLYPIQALAQVGEGDAVDVVRVSPRESTLLPAPDGKPVEGVGVGHFYAFLSREARENDYLRGRLDAAEQFVRLLLGVTDSRFSLEDVCKPVFEAILEEDADALDHIPVKLSAIRRQIETL
jgi:patatin-related protein